MDIIKHECYQHSDDDSDHGRGYIRLIEEENYGKDQKYYRHQTACKSVESIGDIDGIDDRDSDEEGEYRIE
jgi:hypothetical protein